MSVRWSSPRGKSCARQTFLVLALSGFTKSYQQKQETRRLKHTFNLLSTFRQGWQVNRDEERSDRPLVMEGGVARKWKLQTHPLIAIRRSHHTTKGSLDHRQYPTSTRCTKSQLPIANSTFTYSSRNVHWHPTSIYPILGCFLKLWLSCHHSTSRTT